MFCAMASLPSTSVPFALRSPFAASSRKSSLRIAAVSTSAEAASSSSLYQVLGVPRGAAFHEIKAAYRRLARVLHPDVVASGQKENSADEFMQVHAAYLKLSDPEKRADYDRMLLDQMMRPFPSASPSRSAYSFGGCSRRTWETDQCW